jgi:hypothetical protein
MRGIWVKGRINWRVCMTSGDPSGSIKDLNQLMAYHILDSLMNNKYCRRMVLARNVSHSESKSKKRKLSLRLTI